MKLLLVGGLSTDEDEVDSLHSLGEYMGRLLDDDVIDMVHLDDIIYEVSNERIEARTVVSQRSLREYDAVYIRGPKMRLRSEQAYYLSRFCKNNGIRCVNDYSLYYPGTKVAQMMIFFEEQAPLLDTLYTLSNHDLIAAAEQKLGYPYILKTTSGSHGDANYLVEDKAAAEQALREEPTVDFLAQQFCKNDRDYRVLVTPDSSLIFARRGSADTHLNNTSKGAQALLATQGEISDTIVAMTRRVAARLNLELAGVDVMPNIDTGEVYFLEINSQPQFVTGAFLDEKAALISSLFGAHEG
jgi:glutathione synthase/RimK-type ligase-like ATP-grasp enzyme